MTPETPPPASWIDRLVAWVAERRAPWLVVTLIWLGHIALVAVITGVLAGSGGDVTIFQASQAVYGMVGLVAYGLLTRRGERAFTRFLPALGGRRSEAERWHRSITSMSNRMATITVVVGGAFGLVAGFYEPRVTTVVEEAPIAGALLLAVNYWFNVAAAAIVLVHMVRVARGVTRLHRLAGDIDIFAPDPAHAFAGVTGLAGGVLILMMAYSAVTDPATFENPVWIAMILWGPVLAVLVFVLPLLGMRRLLRARKEALLDASMARIRRTAAMLDAAADAGDYDRVAKVKTALDALDQERQRIGGASTFPWEGRTVRAFGTTLLLPLISWLITSVLGKTLGL